MTVVFWFAMGLSVLAGNAPLDPIVPQLIQMGAGESTVTADAEFDPTVAVAGEPALFRLVVTAHAESAAQPDTIPVPAGLTVRAGGSSMGLAINGRGLQFRTTFLYWVTARQPGVYHLPAFTISANSRQVPVPAQTLLVVPPGSPEAVRPAKLTVEVPPGTYYVGQKIMLPVVLRDPGDNSVYGINGTKGEGNDFIFDSGMGQQSRSMRDYGGKPVSAIIDRLAAIPVRDGELTLTAQAVVYCRGTRHLQEAMPGYQPVFESQPATVRVKHLPKGELPGFTGLIGHFAVAAPVATPPGVRAGDPLDLAVTVTGEGNLDRLLPPPLADTADWQVFPATPDVNAPAAIEQRRSNTFHYTLIPRRAGTLATPVIPFSYFDPDRTAYFDLTIPSIMVTVLPPAGVPAAAAAPAAPPALPEAAPPAVLPELARQPVHFGGAGLPWSERTGFRAGQLVPAALFLGLWGWDRRRRYLAAHPEVGRRARALRGLQRQRRAMRQAAERGDAAAFTSAAVDALREAGAPVDAANPQALVGEDILAALPEGAVRSAAEPLVRPLFAAVERMNYRGEAPAPAAVFARQAELEELLEYLRRRLC